MLKKSFFSIFWVIKGNKDYANLNFMNTRSQLLNSIMIKFSFQ